MGIYENSTSSSVNHAYAIVASGRASIKRKMDALHRRRHGLRFVRDKYNRRAEEVAITEASLEIREEIEVVRSIHRQVHEHAAQGGLPVMY